MDVKARIECCQVSTGEFFYSKQSMVGQESLFLSLISIGKWIVWILFSEQSSSSLGEKKREGFLDKTFVCLNICQKNNL